MKLSCPAIDFCEGGAGIGGRRGMIMIQALLCMPAFKGKYNASKQHQTSLDNKRLSGRDSDSRMLKECLIVRDSSKRGTRMGGKTACVYTKGYLLKLSIYRCMFV